MRTHAAHRTWIYDNGEVPGRVSRSAWSCHTATCCVAPASRGAPQLYQCDEYPAAGYGADSCSAADSVGATAMSWDHDIATRTR
jgi:hypothetical protein